ncbi:MAG: DUF721 domain-containing protein [Chromatiaceae bacterium]|nr:DUF721 domain-containing protein [Chromatiaceae bacterium]
MPKKFQHACRFLQRNEKIAGYLTAIERDARLLREIRSILPFPLDEHCLHASLESSVLTLVTDSPVWSSRLRFFGPELERDLFSLHGSIASCRIRVQPHARASSGVTESTRKTMLSPRAAQHLMEAAEGIDDLQIAAALRRLAKAGAGDR